MKNQYATFIHGIAGNDAATELTTAIRAKKTWISKGPILETHMDSAKRSLSFSLAETGKPGFPKRPLSDYVITLKTSADTYAAAFNQEFPLERLGGAACVIPKLYCGSAELENLVCVAPPFHLSAAKNGLLPFGAACGMDTP